MQELINKLTTEVGLTAEQAAKTVATMVDHIKSKLPPALAGNIDALISGGKMEQKEESLKEKAEDLAEATKEKLEDLTEATKDKLEDFAEQAKDKISDAADKAEEIAKDAFGKLKGMFGGDKDKK